MYVFVELLFNGISTGAIYALLALAFVVVIRAANFVNFAQGDFLMLPAYFVVSSLTALHLAGSIALALIAGVVVGGGLFYLSIYRPLQRASQMIMIAGTIGVDMMLQNGISAIYGANPQSVPLLVSGTTNVGGYRFDNQDILVIVVALLVFVGQFVLFEHTHVGRMMRAVSQDRGMAAASGISVTTMLVATFAIAALVSGIAGIVVAPVYSVTPSMGVTLSLSAFAAIIIGGFDSVIGAALGGLLIGVVNSLDTFYISSEYSEAILFAIVIVFLIVRPTGIFGESIGTKV